MGALEDVEEGRAEAWLGETTLTAALLGIENTASEELDKDVELVEATGRGVGVD